jgi:hypothetical protein
MAPPCLAWKLGLQSMSSRSYLVLEEVLRIACSVRVGDIRGEQAATARRGVFRSVPHRWPVLAGKRPRQADTPRE